MVPSADIRVHITAPGEKDPQAQGLHVLLLEPPDLVLFSFLANPVPRILLCRKEQQLPIKNLNKLLLTRVAWSEKALVLLKSSTQVHQTETIVKTLKCELVSRSQRKHLRTLHSVVPIHALVTN